MRRTGGTSLTALLRVMSEYRGPSPKIGVWPSTDEPFNIERTLGRFIKEYRQGVNKNLIYENILEALKKTPLIKHCYEIFGEEFNDIIIDSLSNYSYKHVFLCREDEVSRILSLYLAMQTNVWGAAKKDHYETIIKGEIQLEPFDINAMKKHLKWCIYLTKHIKARLDSMSIEYKEISFEDFYIGDREKD